MKRRDLIAGLLLMPLATASFGGDEANKHLA